MKKVAPFTGAWIEITKNKKETDMIGVSHPSRVRGLKYGRYGRLRYGYRVAPFTGAWIEMAYACARGADRMRSHPSRVRGLK